MRRAVVGVIVAVGLLRVTAGVAQTEFPCLEGQEAKITRGLNIAPVPLDLEGRNRNLVGLGSYIVNAQGAVMIAIPSPTTPPAAIRFSGSRNKLTRRAIWPVAGRSDRTLRATSRRVSEAGPPG